MVVSQVSITKVFRYRRGETEGDVSAVFRNIGTGKATTNKWFRHREMTFLNLIKHYHVAQRKIFKERTVIASTLQETKKRRYLQGPSSTL